MDLSPTGTALRGSGAGVAGRMFREHYPRRGEVRQTRCVAPVENAL